MCYFSKIFPLIFLCFVLNNVCKSASIESIISDFWSKNTKPESTDMESLFSHLQSEATDVRSNLESLHPGLWPDKHPIPLQPNQNPLSTPYHQAFFQQEINITTKQIRQVEDDRPVWGPPQTQAAQQAPKLKPSGSAVQEKEEFRSPTGVEGVEQPMQTTTNKYVRGPYRYPTKIITRQEQPLVVLNSLKEYFTSPSTIYCLNYCKIPYMTGFAQGGVDAIPHEFPHMVTLGYGSGTLEGRSLVSWNKCGGSLISKNFVLTAAHCVDSDSGPPNQVRLGEHNLNKVDPKDISEYFEPVPPRDFPILRIIKHPGYGASHGLYHDIALLQLAQDVPFTSAQNLLQDSDNVNIIWPACLHQGPNIKHYKHYQDEDDKVMRVPRTAVATGWGNTGFADAPSDILQKVDLDIIDHNTCSNLLGTDTNIPNGVDEQTQVCAGVLAGGVDTCNGDSGGPLQINNTIYSAKYCPMEIVGITSLGRDCGQPNTPSVYTKVSYYVPWIESIVWPTVPKVIYNDRGWVHSTENQ